MPEVTLRLTIIESPDGGEWHVTADSPHGRARMRVPAPFDPHELDIALLEVERALDRSASPLITRRSETPYRVVHRFGHRLSTTLMAGQAAVILDRCRTDAKNNHAMLRVLLNVDGPGVSRIPWEFAIDPQSDDFLALRVALARAPDVGQPVAPAEVRLPLRVLCVQSTPRDLDPLDAEAERRRITEAFATVSSDHVLLTWMRGDHWQDLSDALREEPWHVLHFIGHGGYDRDLGMGFVELTGEDGRAMRLSALDLGHALAENEALRLVVLNSCDTALGGSGAEDFASTAETVMREGIPAVLAMQHEISDRAAADFAAAFYGSIARGHPVDQAVTRARALVKVSAESLEWATPVLFLASDETRIFDVEAPRRDAPSGSPPAIRDDEIVGPPAPAPQPSASPDHGGPVHQPRPDPAEPVLDRDLVTPPLGTTRFAALGPRGLVVMLDEGPEMRVWSMSSNRWAARCLLPSGAEPQAVTWSPWPRHLATVNADRTVVIWDLETEVPVRVLRPSLSRVQSLAFSTDGRWLAVAGEEHSVRVFDAEGAERQRLEIEPSVDAGRSWFGTTLLGPIAFTPDDRNLVVATNDGAVTLVSRTGSRVLSWPQPQAVTDLDRSPHGLVTRAVDGRVRIWRWDGRLVHKGDASRRADHVAMDANGYVATSAADGTLAVLSSVGRVVGAARAAGPVVGVGAGPQGTVTVTSAGVVERWASPLLRSGGGR